MFAKISYWEQEFNNNTNLFINAFSGLSDAQWHYKPNANTWSIAENMQHIIAVNMSYFPTLKSLQAGQYRVSFLGRFGWIVNALGNLIYKSVSQDRSRKMKTFPIWQPHQAKLASNSLLEEFKQHHQLLIDHIKQSSSMLEKGTVIASPANKNIVYTLEKAFDIILEHEKRHFNQALEITFTHT